MNFMLSTFDCEPNVPGLPYIAEAPATFKGSVFRFPFDFPLPDNSD